MLSPEFRSRLVPDPLRDRSSRRAGLTSDKAPRRTNQQPRIAWTVALITAICGPSSDAQEPVVPLPPGDTALPVAAWVNDVQILVADVELRVREALGGRAVTEDARRLLQAEALRQLIDQQKVLVQLQRRDEACTEQELDVELQRLRDDLSRQEKTLADYCHSLQVPESSLRRMVQWQLSWKRCREKNLSESNLRRYFERHARDFDGTRLRVAHILWRPDRDTPRAALISRAQDLRAQLLAGDLTFAEAARRHSQAPTADSGGELGWIDRNEPMPDSFSQAAYQLEAGQISPPVESPFGIHLIKCLEIQPGQKTWQDVHEQVADAAAEYLFRWLADRPEPQHDVRFSDEVPHFLPGTRQLSR